MGLGINKWHPCHANYIKSPNLKAIQCIILRIHYMLWIDLSFELDLDNVLLK